MGILDKLKNKYKQGIPLTEEEKLLLNILDKKYDTDFNNKNIFDKLKQKQIN